MKKLRSKPKIKKESISMPKQKPEVRKKNFKEVALGYTEGQAIAEAERCLQCPKPQCVEGCPVEIDIPAFIRLLLERKFDEAIEKIKEKNSLPAICGRVCPQEEQCQQHCVMGKAGDPINIGRLERFAADYEMKRKAGTHSKQATNGKKIAVIGGGPAGLTAAADLAKLGYKVVIFEALHKLGGVLVYGIPEFRLPKKIVAAEVDYVKKLGVDVKPNALIGRLFTIPELLNNGFDAVFIGTGAGLPRFLRLPGENFGGIYSANEFLIRVNLMKSYAFPSYDTPIRIGNEVAVIGAGNVAMDSARSALRLGAEKVSIVYRRSKEEMPARAEEIENAEEEGIIFRLLTNPTRFLGDEKGWVKQMECLQMQLGEPDESGRRRPIPIKNSEFFIDIDTAIIAVGRTPNPIIQRTTRGLETTKWGTIVVNEISMETGLKGVYAGGDIVTGEATVISAMGAGKRAARAIHEYLHRKIRAC
ncbi:MAG: NADPH-dependent glutamate synthase [Candidatus Bathyarchaeota archaeon]|nr:MAG: NADPH-dependent glutamate synthase [Candidatus Bathyarchaeota archaeon]